MKPAFPNRTHHWWPKVLSSYWAGDDGCATQLLWDGRSIRKVPKIFGANEHTHNIRIGGPWNSGFEHIFDHADNAMRSVIDWLITLRPSADQSHGSNLHERMLTKPMTSEQQSLLGECIASLVVRSPAMQHRIRPGALSLHDRTAVSISMQPLLGYFANPMAQFGKYIVLFAKDGEFIFGDGFFQNFPTTGPSFHNIKCIVPLTPTIAAGYVFPHKYISCCGIVTMRLSREEVGHLNHIVQIYSCDSIFYRNDPPEICQEFKDRRHYSLQHHREPWTDALFHSLAAFPTRPVETGSGLDWANN
ncbi:MAG: hypothetical protein JSR99_15270 [Proteobacteria bacterium]|nr:hypothetical protein [Pseudomonadota bacterium]